MAQALYRKYRSRSFGEVVGQEHITRTLQNALKSGRISHAYLFTGPRGVGKTSVARILAHEVNGLDYKDEAVHLDIIEIDAASNRRIDEIRDLREKVRVAPVAGKYKIYIIDEVHMLTREAFNALLKTLEEPPAHCIFILATTEAHKLPETIISRTQRFEFRPVKTDTAAAHLESIAKREKIDIDKDALGILAEFGGGSFRDSISYLDQLSSYGKKIGAEDVRSLLGLPPAAEIERLMDSLAGGSQAGLLEDLGRIQQQGVNAAAVAAALSTRLRGLAVQQALKPWQLQLLRRLLEVSASSRPQAILEISLLEAAAAVQPTNRTRPAGQGPKHSAESAAQPAAKPATKSTGFDISRWQDVVTASKHKDASVYTALRLAVPNYADGTLTLAFQFPLHQKKLEQAKNKQLVADIIDEITGGQPRIETLVDKHAGTAASPAKPDESAGLISNIFGGAEVMEA